MNCREFEQAVIDLDRDQSMETPLPAPAQAHVEGCAPCAAWLGRERRMTAGLRALAAEEAVTNAPERVGAALRAAFEERSAAAPPPKSSWPVRRRLVWGLAAAAVLLLSVMIIGLRRHETHPPEAGPQAKLELPSSIAANSAPESAPDPLSRPPVRRAPRRARPAPEKAVENGSDFFPLTFVAKSEPTEFIQTVRVEIPRSTLLMMGWPVNIDRGEGMIKADIIIGEDGVARAVRLLN
ncbi:MAG TPA: hypothetical protein VJ302_33345 [Blastocatellia bacterium]|nr:hypothetical protein [Blastocatellia bacterium]